MDGERDPLMGLYEKQFLREANLNGRRFHGRGTVEVGHGYGRGLLSTVIFGFEKEGARVRQGRTRATIGQVTRRRFTTDSAGSNRC